MLRDALHHHHVGQRLDHLRAVPAPLGDGSAGTPGVFIDQVQHPHRPSVVVFALTKS
jgi:hypothetical protein